MNPRCILPILFVLLVAASAEAQLARPPVEPFISWPSGPPGALDFTPEDTAMGTAYFPPLEKSSGALIIIFPGGGYGALAPHEGLPIARWLNSLGIAAIVQTYRLGPRYQEPAMMQDGMQAVRAARSEAKRWRIDADRIGVMGFSAGGHLASTVGTHFDAGDPDSRRIIPRFSSEPNAMLLLYPVITMGEGTHEGSKKNLLGPNPSAAKVEFYSNEKHVTKDTPPTFIVHSEDDKAVPIKNAEMFVAALEAAGVKHEFVRYKTGGHGYGLGKDKGEVADWPEKAAAWLKELGWVKE